MAADDFKSAAEPDMRLIAASLQRDHPRWLIVFGVYTREFVAFPLFEVPWGGVIAVRYPAALPGKMQEIENSARSWELKDRVRRGLLAA